VRFAGRIVWIAIFLTAAAGAFCSHAQQPSGSVNPGNDVQPEARVLVTIASQKGGSIVVPNASAISIRDNGRPVQGAELQSVKDEPLVFSLLVDTSGSMRAIRPTENDAAEKIFIALDKPGNQAYLNLFPAGGSGDLDGRVVDLGTARREIGFSGRRGSTNLYDSIGDAVPLLTSSRYSKIPRRVIVALTDGDDNSSRTSFGGALGSLQRFGIPLIGVYIRDPNFRNGTNSKGEAKESRKNLRNLCEYSGGEEIDYDEPGAFLASILSYLDNQYLLRFAPSPESPHDLHSLQLKCSLSDCAVSAPAWYFAP